MKTKGIKMTIEGLPEKYHKLLGLLVKSTPGQWDATFKQDVYDDPPAVIEKAGEKHTIGDHWDAEILTAEYHGMNDIEFCAEAHNVTGDLLSDLAAANREILELKQKINSYMALEKLRTGITRIENMELPK